MYYILLDDVIASCIMLCCGHLACYACVQSYRENTGLTGVNCKICKKESSFSNIGNKEDSNDFHFDKIIGCLLNEYERSLRKLSGE